jgi:hypothetical protein
MASSPDPTDHLAAGVVLQPGEDAWMRVPARLAVRTSHPAWTAHTHVSWLGRRAQNVTHETTTEQWKDHGQIDWLITSQRIAGWLPASSEMFSVWWSGVAGVDINLEGDRILLNGLNGWTGMLKGPTLAPIAVAAIAMCHGPEALLLHPAVKDLWQQGTNQLPLPQLPEAVGSDGMIVRLPTRRRAT